METVKRIDKVLRTDKKRIESELEKIIKANGIQITRLVIFHYFKKYKDTTLRKKRIAELKKEIKDLNSKG